MIRATFHHFQRHQKEQYLIPALKAYRDGDRQKPNMSPLAQGLSDEDIENLAAYYSGL